MTSQDPDPTQSTPIAPSTTSGAWPPSTPPSGAYPGAYPPVTPPPDSRPPAASQTFSPPPVTPPPATPSPAPPPAWRPPPADYGRNGAFVFGVILVIIGLWFFATTTLGLALPRLDWGALWPLLLIGLGAWIVFGAMGRRR